MLLQKSKVIWTTQKLSWYGIVRVYLVNISCFLIHGSFKQCICAHFTAQHHRSRPAERRKTGRSCGQIRRVEHELKGFLYHGNKYMHACIMYVLDININKNTTSNETKNIFLEKIFFISIFDSKSHSYSVVILIECWKKITVELWAILF